MKTIQQLKTQLLFETKQSNAFRMRRNEAQTKETKQAWQTLIDLSEKSKEKLRVQLIKLDKGLKAPAKTKGLTTLCAKQVGVTGRRKSDGTQKKGYVAKKGGQLVKKKTVTKKK